MDGLGMGRLLMALGAILLVLGALLTFGGRLPGLGRLPGDIVIQRENFTLYVPLTTMILVSLALTLIFSLLSYLRR